jgi:hypothetical protein
VSAEGDDLDSYGPQANATRVVVYRGDGGIGAMSLGFGRDLEDEDRPRQGS